MKMARRFVGNIGCYFGLLLIDFALGCEDQIKCPKSTESVALSVMLCIAGVAAIVCPLLCLIGPFKRMAIRWRKYLHDNLGWEYPERGQRRQRQCQVEYDVPPEYVNIAFIDLPPSYDEVIKNSQHYNYGQVSSSVSAPEQHHHQHQPHQHQHHQNHQHHQQQQVRQNRPRSETCHQICGRLEYVQEPSSITVSNSSINEPRDRTNYANIQYVQESSSITVPNSSIQEESSKQSNNIHQMCSTTVPNDSVTNVQEQSERPNIGLCVNSRVR